MSCGRPRTRARVLAVAGIAALALPACSNGARREAASLIEAVDRFRRAEGPAKPSAAPAIDAAPCTDAEVCATKRACSASAQPTARGFTLKAEVEMSLADLRAGKITQDEAASRALPQKLDEAQHLLDEGHSALADCDAHVTSLRLKYGL